MSNVRILYNPFEDKTTLFYNRKQIDNTQNRIVCFAEELTFERLLAPYKEKYKVWQGLLMELILELEDDEIDIVFEGRQTEFELLEQAFEKSREIVISNGYANNWTLSHMVSYESGDLAEKVKQVISEAEDYFDDPSDKQQLKSLSDSLAVSSNPNEFGKAKKLLCNMIQARLEQIEHEDSPYKVPDMIMMKRLMTKVIQTFDDVKLGGIGSDE